MVRKALCGMIAIAVAAVAITLAMLFMHKEYEATCGLAYGHNVGGTIHYAFENGGNSAAYDRLATMREVWLSPSFRSRVYNRVRADCANPSTNDMIKAISLAEVEIRARKVSVLVRVKASSQEIACACAKAFSREIVDATAVKGRECKQKGVGQLKLNCEKRERYVANLRKKLCQLKAEKVEERELTEAEDWLISQERILVAMKMDVAKLQAEDSWCGFFEEMNDDSEVTNAK